MNKIGLITLLSLAITASCKSSVSSWDNSSETPIALGGAFNNMPLQALQSIALASFIVGTIFLLFGLKMLKFIIFVIGFIIFFGATLTISGGFYFINNPNSQGSDVVVLLLLSIVFGIGGGYIALCCHKFAIFMIGFVFGVALFGILAMFLNLRDIAGGVAFIGGIATGVFTIWLYEKLVIIYTSFIGASMLCWSIAIFIHQGDFATGFTRYPSQYLFLEIGLAVLGIVYQNKTKPVKLEGSDPLARNYSSPDIYVLNVNNNSTPVYVNPVYNQPMVSGNPSYQPYQPFQPQQNFQPQQPQHPNQPQQNYQGQQQYQDQQPQQPYQPQQYYQVQQPQPTIQPSYGNPFSSNAQ